MQAQLNPNTASHKMQQPLTSSAASSSEPSESEELAPASSAGLHGEPPTPQESTLRQAGLQPRDRSQAARRWAVHSTTSATTTEVSSALPPTPSGVGCTGLSIRNSDLACALCTMLRAISESTEGCAGTNDLLWLGGSLSLQISTTSLKKRLSKTPSLPRISRSPSYVDVQCSPLPRSMASSAWSSSKAGSMLSLMRASCRGVWLCPPIRCISVWRMTWRRPWRPPVRRNITSSQSPRVTTPIIGCSLPWIWVELSMTASRTDVEPRLSVSE
mmetsp:Transcript_16057/g.44179  ORF Transcript_16057/g.44179 Transcript_16057/m.44179 type:complete len:272 (+) Transcript_16057:179-994(+)